MLTDKCDLAFISLKHVWFGIWFFCVQLEMCSRNVYLFFCYLTCSFIVSFVSFIWSHFLFCWEFKSSLYNIFTSLPCGKCFNVIMANPGERSVRQFFLFEQDVPQTFVLFEIWFCYLTCSFIDRFFSLFIVFSPSVIWKGLTHFKPTLCKMLLHMMVNPMFNQCNIE